MPTNSLIIHLFISELITAMSRIRYDTIAEFNVDSKAEYSALSSTRSQIGQELLSAKANEGL